MHTVNRLAELRQQVREWHRQGLEVGLVPTMGSLHEWPLSLSTEPPARPARVVVSIFVNPLQFGEGEDYESYPRSLEADCARLLPLGVDAVFAPPVAEIYPDGSNVSTRVEVPGISDILCGSYRPGHFVGVTTIVAKLFNMVVPDLAVFGKKDYQQLTIIRRMVRELNFPVQVVGVDTVREGDGLARSSRNAYLDARERETASQIYSTLREAAASLQAGESDLESLETWGRERLDAHGFVTDYFSIRRQADLEPPAPGDSELVILAAARLGKARLIDNIEVRLNATV
jgi:pantoate--beta-alanine ligase